MKFVLTDFPVFYDAERYDQAIEAMCNRLLALPAVRSIYQVGSVSTPGISDIDLVVVFEDGTRILGDPRAGLSKVDRYLFVHALYGETLSNFRRVYRVSSFHNFKLLHGEEIVPANDALTGVERNQLETQLALEYLLRMYVNLMVQSAFRVYKVRGFFLHTKAVMYDLEFLGVGQGQLFELTEKAIETRNQWFNKGASNGELCSLIQEFQDALERFLKSELVENTFFLPQKEQYRLAPNILLKNSHALGYHYEGVGLPAVLGKIHSKFFNLQHRFVNFEVRAPFNVQAVPLVLRDRFELVEGLKRQHRKDLPSFEVMTSSLNIYV